MRDTQLAPKPYNFFFLWVIIALVSIANGIYIQFFSIDKEISMAIFHYAMAVAWVCIGWSFNYAPPTKK